MSNKSEFHVPAKNQKGIIHDYVTSTKMYPTLQILPEFIQNLVRLSKCPYDIDALGELVYADYVNGVQVSTKDRIVVEETIKLIKEYNK